MRFSAVSLQSSGMSRELYFENNDNSNKNKTNNGNNRRAGRRVVQPVACSQGAF